MLFTSVGCICIPALVAFIANQAAPAERGALLGGVETLQEACLALAHSSYGRLFALFISDKVRRAGVTVAQRSCNCRATVVQRYGNAMAATATLLQRYCNAVQRHVMLATSSHLD